jgi:1-acyl-sn-glycerol-3-phosphate acyltransferase
VVPAFIRYRLTEDNGPDVSVSDDVSYWDDTPLAKHVFRLMGLKGVEITVRFADSPILFTVGPEEREAAAEEARTAVMELGEMSPVAAS